MKHQSTEVLRSYCSKAEAKDNMGIGYQVQTRHEVSYCCSATISFWEEPEDCVVVQFMDFAEKVSVPCLLLDLYFIELESDGQLWVLLTSGVLTACTNYWSQGTTEKGCFQFKYISLVVFQTMNTNICFCKRMSCQPRL